MLLRGTSRFEKVYYPWVTTVFGKAQGRPAVVILGVNIGTVVEQKTHHFYTALPTGEPIINGEHQDRPAVVILGVNVGTVFKQKTRHRHITPPSRIHQNRRAGDISGVNVSAVFNQKTHHRHITPQAPHIKTVMS